MSKNERVCLGVVVGAQGIKGEVKIKSFTEDLDAIDQYGQLENEDGSKNFAIKITGNFFILLAFSVIVGRHHQIAFKKS